MKVLVFLNGLGIGGTEKAACRWAVGLSQRGHSVSVASMVDGPRHAHLARLGIPVDIAGPSVSTLLDLLRVKSPDVIHAHAPGCAHDGDMLGEALTYLPKIPVVQTNIFGRLDNPREGWVDFRLFISWTSCVQAARRSSLRLDESFFRRASVAAYPLDADDGPSPNEVNDFRESLGVLHGDVVFGRFSRPEPNKWTDLPVHAFRRALKYNHGIKLLLREPPPEVSSRLRESADCRSFIILPSTSDADLLRRTMAATDVVLHTSSMGESFGYGIAEPMNFGKPVITNSVPWLDQAQLELVRHGGTGLAASTTNTMVDAILLLARDRGLRERLGAQSKVHIRGLADPEVSLNRLERALETAVASKDSDTIQEDIETAHSIARNLDLEQFGHSYEEQFVLRAKVAKIRLRSWASSLKRKWMALRRSPATQTSSNR